MFLCGDGFKPKKTGEIWDSAIEAGGLSSALHPEFCSMEKFPVKSLLNSQIFKICTRFVNRPLLTHSHDFPV
jgi:hypothetical protein